MPKLIVMADPMREVEIFEVFNADGGMHKISQLQIPQKSVDFIRNYSNSVKEIVDVTYVGPKDYVTYFVSQVNNLEFAKAHRMEDNNA